MSDKKLNIVVLVSGRGSNLQAILEVCAENKINAQVNLVLSDQNDAFALERAQKFSIATKTVVAEKGEKREDYDRRLIEVLNQYSFDYIILAGFMRLLSSHFIKTFQHKIINIHPSLLPAFTGLNAQKQAFDYGVRFSGATVHFVDEGCDTGPIILQAVVPVLENDSADELAARILEQEHLLLPKAIDLLAKNKVRLNGRKVILED